MPSEEPIARGPRRWIVALAVCGVAAAGSFALTYSPLFRATTIRVTGAGSIGQLRLRSLSGVVAGVNVYHLDASAAERRLEADPRVESATVTRRLPSTVVIEVTERVPVALVADGLGGFDRIGADGVSMGVGARRGSLPVLEWAGDRTSNRDEVLVAASVATGMSPELRGLVRTIITSTGGSVRLVLRSGVVVSYGPPTDVTAKGQAVEAVLRWARARGREITAVDVNVPGAPTATTTAGTATRVG
jgi:cell division protein FtsQ